MTTKRLRAFARAIERLSARDMVFVVTAICPDSQSLYRENRHLTTMRLLDVAEQYAEFDKPKEAQ